MKIKLKENIAKEKESNNLFHCLIPFHVIINFLLVSSSFCDQQIV